MYMLTKKNLTLSTVEHLLKKMHIYIQLDYAPIHPKISLFGGMSVLLLIRTKEPCFL